MKTKKLVYILSTIGVIALIVLILVLNKKATANRTNLVAEKSSAVAVRAEVIRDSTYTISFTSNGMIRAIHELAFVSETAGRVVYIYADEGNKVQKGQVLIQLDNETLSADYRSNEATYQALKKDYERFQKANAQGGITDQQLDNIRTQLVAAESRYISSRRRLADSSVKSPISGTIIRRYVEVGSYINPGTKLFDIIDDSQLKVMSYVTEHERTSIQTGQTVQITSELYPDRTFTGTISFVGEKADGSLNFPIEVVINGDKEGLKSGMMATLWLGEASTKSGILVPRSAISGSVKNSDVYVINNGIAHKKPVITGRLIGEKIEILGGIQAGDSIAVAGLINLADGAEVKVIK